MVGRLEGSETFSEPFFGTSGSLNLSPRSLLDPAGPLDAGALCGIPTPELVRIREPGEPGKHCGLAHDSLVSSVSLSEGAPSSSEESVRKE